MEFNPLYDYGQSDLTIDSNLIYWKYGELIKNLITLSSQAEKQVEVIGHGAVCDEMAEDFDTYFYTKY